MLHTRMTTLVFLLLELSPFVLFLKLILCPLCYTNTLQNMAFLLLELSPFVLFFKLILCPLCYVNTLWNILMVFGRNVEQDETRCCVQE